LRLAEQGEPLLVLAALLLTYGATELVHGYGFLAVFACAMALRSAEHRDEYHQSMHDVISRLERLFTLAVLLMLGIAFSSGLLSGLDWRGVVAGAALVFVIRPACALASLAVRPRSSPHAGGLDARGRRTVAFFGVRGVGSLFYLAWATGETDVADAGWLWSTVAFTIGLSVVVHGIASTPAMRRLDDEPFLAQTPI
jgi:NhaP-type Na+/H+ or K+/H+ antiporter